MAKIPLDKSLYSRHFNVLRLIGAWVVDPSDPLMVYFYSAYKTLMTLVAVAACFSLFSDFYMVFGNFEKMTWNLCITALFTTSLVKNIYTIHKSSVINGLRIKLHRDASKRESLEDDILNRLSLKELKVVQTLFYGAAFIFIPAWLVSRYVTHFWGPRDIPVPFRLPVKVNFEDDLEFSCAFLIVGIIGCTGLVLVMETEMAMFTILIQISREYRRLLNDISKINELYDSCKMNENDLECQSLKRFKQEVNPWLRKIRTKMLLKECADCQQQLIEYTKDFEFSYSRPMLLQMFAVSLLVTVSAIQCILEYGRFSTNLSYQTGYTSILVVDMFLLCWFATRIRFQCFRVGEEAYSILWYQMGVDIQKDICMIIMRSQHPPRITSGKVIEMNLPTFTVIMRNIYSWLALFQQLEFKINE